MKKFLSKISLMLAAVIALSSLSVTAFAADKLKSADGEYEYRLIGKFAELTDYIAEGTPALNEDGSYTIPSEVDGHEVRFLGSYLYAYNDVPSERVIIPDTVTFIDGEAFAYEKEVEYDGYKGDEYESDYEYCSKMKYITIPDSIVNIGDYAFHGTVNLEEVTIPESVRYLGKYAFASSGVKKVVIKDGLRRIGDYAFYGCSKLKEVVIPEKVTSIGKQAFIYCNSLKELNVNFNTVLGKYAYGVDSSGKPEKNHSLVLNLNRSIKTSYAVKYANESKVPLIINVNSKSSSLFLENPGLEFTYRVNGETVSDCATSDKNAATATKKGKVKFVGKTRSSNITATDSSGEEHRLRLHSFGSVKLSKKSITVARNKTKTVKINGKVESINNKYYNTKYAKFTSSKSASTLEIKGLKKGKTTLKVKVNNAVTLKVSVNVV